MIYLDNAATTMPKPQVVIDAVALAMSGLGNAGRGAHTGALQASRAVYNARVKLAQLFHVAKPELVAFTANATEALNIAIHGAIPLGSHVISTDWEHNSVLRPLYRLQAEGKATLSFVPADERGRLEMSAFESLIQPDTRAIVCNHASNVTGDVLDVAAVSAIAKRHGLLLVLDASQTAGVLPLDMQALGVDILCFTGHKGLMGPQGTGGLCLRPGVEVRPFKTGGTGVQSYRQTQPDAYPTRLEAGTLNGHGLAGLSAALDLLDSLTVEEIEQREKRLTQRFYRGVSDVDGVTIYGNVTAPRHTATVSLNIRNEDSGVISDLLIEQYGIATRPGAHCAPRMHQALHTVQQGVVRFSFNWQNTADEVDAAVLAVQALAR